MAGPRVTYTGSQSGMTDHQLERLETTLKDLKPSRGCHGDCIGGDEQFHNLCLKLKIPITIFPCNLLQKRAFCLDAEVVHQPRPPLDRNRIMVKLGDLVIAAPYTSYEITRSGTWTTIRYTRKIHKPLIVIYPGGEVMHETT